MASPTRTVPGGATDWRRAAVLTRSPATIPWPVAPTVTAASPVRTPARACDRRPERPDGVDELEAGPHRPLGVVLVGDRRAPDRHDRVADELLDRPAVAGDHLAGELEVAGEGVADLLRVALLGEGGEADEVGEEDRDEPALGDGGGGRPGGRTARRRRGRRCSGDERGRALAAELRVGAVGRSAGRTDQRESSRAFLAELAPRLVLGPAARADHPALRCDVWDRAYCRRLATDRGFPPLRALQHAIRRHLPVTEKAGGAGCVSSRARNGELERETGIEPATCSLEGRDGYA